jgi:hypothetical protein
MMVQKYFPIVAIFLITCFISMAVPACTAASGDTLTRGSQFTITITGLPNTAYYIWVAGTSTLSGNPGDQPPVIAGGQSGIQQDPPGGPYTIGNYAIGNGNGRTILDDVAPSTPDMSNINYYALVTTDRDGRAVVAFRTSSSTATRTFHIRAENSGSVANTDVRLEPVIPVKITVSPSPAASVPVSTPPTIVRVTFPTTTPLPTPTTTYTIATTIPGPTGTPTQASPSGIEVAVFAIATGLVLTSKRKIFR